MYLANCKQYYFNQKPSCRIAYSRITGHKAKYDPPKIALKQTEALCMTLVANNVIRKKARNDTKETIV